MSLPRIALLLVAVSGLVAAKAKAPAHEVRVVMKGVQFVPTQVEAKKGDVVVFQNDDLVPHDIASTATPPVFDSGNLASGAAYRFTVPGPGTFPFFCRYHPTMQGSIVAH